MVVDDCVILRVYAKTTQIESFPEGCRTQDRIEHEHDRFLVTRNGLATSIASRQTFSMLRCH